MTASNWGKVSRMTVSGAQPRRNQPDPNARYVMHPGIVTSQYDHQKHYVGVRHLIICYGLTYHRSIIDANSSLYEPHDNDVHLYPRFDGNYELPEPA